MTADPAPAWLPFAIIAAFLVVFPLMWCLVTGLLSVMGGWQRLAQTFAAGNRPVTGQARHGLNGMVGWVSYRFVLTVHVAPERLDADHVHHHTDDLAGFLATVI